MLKDIAAGLVESLGAPQRRTEKSLSLGLGGQSVTPVWRAAGSGGLAAGSLELIKSYNANPNLRRVVGLIAGSLAATPFFLRRKRVAAGKSWSARVRAIADKAVRTKAVAADSDEVWEHEFLDFLGRGSPFLSGPQSLALSHAYYEIKGEFFWWILPSEQGQPAQYIVIPPHWVSEIPDLNANGGHYRVSFGGAVMSLPRESVLYAKQPGLSDPYGRGVGVAESLADEVDTDEYAAQVMRYVLANRGFQDVLIALKGGTPDQAELVEAKYNQRHRGFYNTGKAMVVDADALEVKQLTHTLSELQLLDLRRWERDLIRETWGIPPELLGLVENSNRATINTAETIYARYVQEPRLEAFRLWLQTQLLPLFDSRGEYVVEYISPIPEDTDRRLEVMRTQPGAFSLNEWRSVAGLDPRDWGDVRAQSFATIEVPAPIEGDGPAVNPMSMVEQDTKALGPARRTKAGAATLTQSEIDQLLALIDSEELAYKLSPHYESEMTRVARRAFSAFPGAVGDFSLVNPLVADYLSQFGGRWITDVDAHTKDLVGNSLALGIDAGESIAELAKRVDQQMGALTDGYRSRLIARTETVRATNAGRLYGWQATELPLSKEWISALTAATRPWHAALHGAVVDVNGTFQFSGGPPGTDEAVLMPANSTSPANACNCLCTAVAFDPLHGKALSLPFGSEQHVAIAKAFESEVQALEVYTLKQMHAFYAQMRTRLVDTLKRMG